MRSHLLILGLHRVGYPSKNAKIRGLFITSRLLGFELWLLKKMGYRFLTLRDALNDPIGKRAVITFDDGYADNFINGLPVLNKFGAPATVFVITNDVGKPGAVWEEASEKLPADLLSWPMLNELHRLGWEVGSHSHFHIHFDQYNEMEQDYAIRQSVREIEHHLGIAPISFAYPYGEYSTITQKILRNSGIRYAVTTNPPSRDNSGSPENLLELSRLSIGGRHFHHYVKALLRTIRITSWARPSESFPIKMELMGFAQKFRRIVTDFWGGK